VLWAHTPAYVQSVLEGTLERRIERQIGLRWSPALVQRTLAGVGGTLAAAHQALADGISGNLAGGTHHASAGEGAGFCVFNDLAVASLALLKAGRVRRLAVIDLDVHQGNGTAAILGARHEVFLFSLHCENNYPLRKVPSTLDIGLPDRTGDMDYLVALERGLAAVLTFRPGLVFFQAGVDVLAADKLGRLALTMEGLERRDRTVLSACKEACIPVVIVMGGGYAEPLNLTVQAHAQTYRVAREVFPG
jgi:acetoin utilization deacetylase AcuC-like enzyme